MRAGDPAVLGSPRVHLRRIDSTNAHARALAARGAPHGTLVTATEQTAGRGRQGRRWTAPPGRSLLMSLLLRDPPALLSLAAGVAVCDAVAETAALDAQLKWPNDVVLPAPADALSKCAGVLVEGRPQEGWAVLGIGVNVAIRPGDLPAELGAGTLGLQDEDVEAVLRALLAALARRLDEPAAALLDAWRARDALYGRAVRWAGGSGTALGVDRDGRLLVQLADGSRGALDAGEVHLGAGARAPR